MGYAWLSGGNSMFLEKKSRFLRRYNFHLRARHKLGVPLPLTAAQQEYSVVDALRLAQANGKAASVQPNGDTVELIAIDVMDDLAAVALLFHRSSPDAADPMYRKKQDDALTLRQAEKAINEEQTVSAHLIIENKLQDSGMYRAALEEIPGISLSVIQAIIAPILHDYKYGYEDRKGEDQETYSTLKVEGVKSEKLTEALKTQTLNYVTLSRTQIPDVIDGDGIVEPMSEKIKFKIIGTPSSAGWRQKLDTWVKNAREAGWEDVSLDLSLEDDRHRTVKLERDKEATEILFVRSEQIALDNELKPCSLKVVPELAKKAIKTIQTVG
jgi:hypothetical protein